ncbi:MAG: hypothetical protein ACOX3A_11280 [bacterium]|jgi:hypothetical protein
MNFKGLRLQMIVSVAVLTFVLILCGQFFYRRYFVLEPLLQTLQQLDGVETVNAEKQNNITHFMVSLTPVDDLAVTYQAVEKVINDAFTANAYKISIDDQRSEELIDLYHQIHFSIFEAISLGNFTSMADVIDAQLAGIDALYYRVSVDEKQIYVQLHHNNDAYLYEIITR